MELSLQGVAFPALCILTAVTLFGCAAFSILAFPHPKAVFGQKLSALIAVLGGVIGLAGSVAALFTHLTQSFIISWTLPFGPCEIGIDPLTSFFLLPVFLISGCAAIYAIGYWPAAEQDNSQRITFFSGLLSTSMALVLMARNSVLFLIAWEIMAIAAYFLLIAEHSRREVRRAGVIYLIATHTGTLFLFVMFFLLHDATGTHLFAAMANLRVTEATAAIIFLSAVIGFGLKAGIMPLHLWLPAAHANAPSHVSALMSGVMLKIGIYGILRIVSFFAIPYGWWGGLLLTAGALSAVFGIAFALGQQDMKRLLAYSSIENIGIITIGIGAGLLAKANGNETLALIAMGGALLHVLNHSLFKSLLFFGAGSVLHATGTRNIDEMGGLAKKMPVTAMATIAGMIALAGLPPLNGFISEFLLYFGFFQNTIGAHPSSVLSSAFVIIALALTGALAVACFVRLYSTIFSGSPRSSVGSHLHEAPLWMLSPMVFLVLCCLLIGFQPTQILKLITAAEAGWWSTAPAAIFVPSLGWLSLLNGGLILLIFLLAIFFARRIASTAVSNTETWGCGYLRPTPRIQYTGSSFSELLIKIFRGVVRPRYHQPSVAGYFPKSSHFNSRIPETQLEEVVIPFFIGMRDRFSQLRRLQHGQLHLYMLYIFVTLAALMLWEQL